MSTMINKEDTQLNFAGHTFQVSRPHRFGLVIHGVPAESDFDSNQDYLHTILLAAENRDAFFALIDEERLVICKNVHTQAPSYRKVRGKSSFGRLSQAEYYHHDGCSCPTKPRFNEIRLPHQAISRSVATAIAPFDDVVRAQLAALPEHFSADSEIAEFRRDFLEAKEAPPVETWDRVQGRVTRLVRREMDAESSREYFRNVDRLAGAYDLPWEMGESRLMLNSHADLARTVQHRRAYQKPKVALEQNGSLVKRWTAEDTCAVGVAGQGRGADKTS